MGGERYPVKGVHTLPNTELCSVVYVLPRPGEIGQECGAGIKLYSKIYRYGSVFQYAHKFHQGF